jgi:hypothetical protein
MRVSHVVAVLFCLCVWGAASVHAAEESKAVEDYKSLYGRDEARVRQTRDPADDIELAGRLLAAAEKAQDQPALAAVLSEKAFDLSSEHAAGHETALAAVDCLESVAPQRAEDCAERRAAVWQNRYDAAPRNDREGPGEELIDALLATVDACLSVGDAADAEKACQRAAGIARAVGSGRREAVTARLQDLRAASRDAHDVENLKGLLENSPDNVAAREKLVRLLLYFGRAAEAPKYLEGVKDAALLKYIPAAAKPLEEAPELACLELGEWFRLLGEDAPKYARVPLYQRALAYLERFLGLHSDEDALRTRAVLARDKVEAALEALGRSRWIDLLEYIDPSRDTVMGEWRRQGDGLAIVKKKTYARILVPVSPTGSYEFKGTFVRTSGDECVSVWLPVLEKGVLLGLSHGHGNSCVLHTPLAEVLKPGTLENGREYTLHVIVLVEGKQVKFSSTLDGKPLLAGEATLSDLQPNEKHALPEPGCFGLCVFDSTCVWLSARVKMRSGRLKTVRPKPKGDILKPGKWHDVLALVDVEKDSVLGGWRRQGAALALPSDVGGRCVVPVIPAGSYELQVVFRRTAFRGPVGFVLPVGPAAVAVVLGERKGEAHELLGVDARKGTGVAVSKPGNLAGGHNQLHARVTLSSDGVDIAVVLNRKPIIRWRGPRAALAVPTAWDVGVPGAVGMGTRGAHAEFSQAQLRVLSGQAVLMR